MSPLDAWIADNDRYLQTALAWLRAQLERMVSVPQSRHSWQQRVFRTGRAPAATIAPPFLPPPLPIPDEMREAETATSPPALIVLARRLGFSNFERHVLLLCAAMELDGRIAGLCARAQSDPNRPFPTFEIALNAFEAPTWDALSPERPFRRWRLIDIHQPAAQPLIRSALKADERIVNFIKGLNYLDDRLAPLLSVRPTAAAALPPSQGAVVNAIIGKVRDGSASANGSGHVLQLIGGNIESTFAVASEASRQLGLVLYDIAAAILPTQSADVETFARLWQRENLLLPIALLIDASEVDRSGSAADAIRRLLGKSDGLIILAAREPWPDLASRSDVFAVTRPTTTEQRQLWVDALGDALSSTSQFTRRLAAQFDFDAASIRKIAHDSLVASGKNESRLPDHLWSD